MPRETVTIQNRQVSLSPFHAKQSVAPAMMPDKNNLALPLLLREKPHLL